MIEVEHLSKNLNGFQLNDISFKLEKGYIMGLIGANGSGKTSLIYTLLNLYHKDEGNIKLCGYDNQKEEKLVKDSIGFVLDENPFNLEMSAKENVDIYSKYYKKFDYDLFEQYCLAFAIDVKKKIKKLSKGTVIKFQLAFALSHNAKLFIMDEPSAGLDPLFRKELLEIMQDIIYDGEKSVLFSTHITEDLDQIADYITFLDRGKILFSMSKEELLEQYKVVSGEEYKINLIPKEYIIYKEKHQFVTKALVNRNRKLNLEGIEVNTPVIEEIMYYIIKAKRGQ